MLVGPCPAHAPIQLYLLAGREVEGLVKGRADAVPPVGQEGGPGGGPTSSHLLHLPHSAHQVEQLLSLARFAHPNAVILIRHVRDGVAARVTELRVHA